MLSYQQIIARSRQITPQTSQLWQQQAAVLVPLVQIDAQPHLLLQVRAAHLRRQPGEICFPGGRMEAADPSPQATALRETTEELGIAASAITIYGQMAPLMTPFSLQVHPVIGEIHDLSQLQANPAEVAEIFTVPLEWLKTETPQRGSIEVATRAGEDFPQHDLSYAKTWQKRSQYQVLFYRYQQRLIWGLTAQIIAGYLQFLD